METEEKYFSFLVKTDFSGSHHRFDQCGVVMYLDSEKVTVTTPLSAGILIKGTGAIEN